MSLVQFLFLVALCCCLMVVKEADGHGMLLDPPNRASMWRFDSESPINYDDNANFCGGRDVQWEINKGKCGVCGDDYRTPQPRPNENTGIYGKGKIAKDYKQGTNITVDALITANHMGLFVFTICALNDPHQPETEDCFFNLTLADGSGVEYKLPTTDTGSFKVELELPHQFTCEHCVLRWHYQTGNNWGVCPDGEGRMGCGPQETFRTCSDIRIK